jgi:hypothetical protein
MNRVKIDFRYPSFLREAIDSEEKYLCVAAGRRTGKTYNFVMWLIEELLSTPKLKGLHVDTTQANIVKYFDRYYFPMLKPIIHLCKWDKQKYVLTLPNQSYIDFGSAERPENLEGFNYDRAILNEAGIILKKESLWTNTLRPMFKGEHTKVRIIGTPKGKNLYHKLFNRYKSFKFAAYDSPFWDKKELENIKKEMPQQVWKQEYLAEFLDNEGVVFRGISECVTNTTLLNKGELGKPYAMAVDLAKHEDFTVIIVCDMSNRQVVYFDRFNNLDWNYQKQKILDAWKKFNGAQLIVDSTGVGDVVYDDLVRAGIGVQGYKFTNSTKKSLIQNLMLSIENREIKFPHIDTLITELETFEYDMSASGNIRYNAPDGMHDDAVIALGLANFLMPKEDDSYVSFI